MLQIHLDGDNNEKELEDVQVKSRHLLISPRVHIATKNNYV